MESRPPNFIENLIDAPHSWTLVKTTLVALFLANLLSLAVPARAADPVPTAEAALARFRTACDTEIKQAVPPEVLKRIIAFRDAPFLMVARKSHVDVTDFIDPKVADAIDHNTFYGSREILTKSAGDVWVLTYGNMSSLTVYLDVTSGAILCVAFIPEG